MTTVASAPADSALQGFNACLFAYGKTGTGKASRAQHAPAGAGRSWSHDSQTFTVLGSDDMGQRAGLVPRVCDYLLQRVGTQCEPQARSYGPSDVRAFVFGPLTACHPYRASGCGRGQRRVAGRVHAGRAALLLQLSDHGIALGAGAGIYRGPLQHHGTARWGGALGPPPLPTPVRPPSPIYSHAPHARPASLIHSHALSCLSTRSTTSKCTICSQTTATAAQPQALRTTPPGRGRGRSGGRTALPTHPREGHRSASERIPRHENWEGRKGKAGRLLAAGRVLPAHPPPPQLGPYVEGLTHIRISSLDSALAHLRRGFRERATAATSANERSSRSHAICTLTLTRVEGTSAVTSRLALVDLAGNERLGATDAPGAGLRAREAATINRSLSTLGAVISALAARASGRPDAVVPYRNSVLTWLMRESLGGYSRTAMVATVGPTERDVAQTLSTLRYAERAKMIKNTAVVRGKGVGSDALWVCQQPAPLLALAHLRSPQPHTTPPHPLHPASGTRTRARRWWLDCRARWRSYALHWRLRRQAPWTPPPSPSC